MAKTKLGVARSPQSFGLFRDHETDWAFKRTLEYMNEKAAEIGECLYVARRIDEANGESWIEEWASLAARVEAFAETSLAQGHTVSAREALWRASNYYRTAEYGCPPDHPRFHELWEKSVENFHKACPLFTPPIQIIEVPFDGYMLPGYFWRSADSDATRPTLVAAGGNDSSGEEIVFSSGPAAVQRGYNFFHFEHPGHRGAVHLYPDCVKRHDYEIPYEAAIDYLETLPGVDGRIALVGYSFGGYVAARVAVHEKRIKAVIPNSPMIDAFGVAMAAWGGMVSIANRIPAAFLVKMLDWKLRKKPLLRALREYNHWTGGATGMSLEESLEATKRFVIQRHELARITCPALALVSAREGEVMVRQAEQFYEAISSPVKKMHVFSLEQDGSDDHCQMDNRARGNQVMFDWLDKVFER